jgi:hypothetical protein
LIINEPRLLAEFEEVLGTLQSIEMTEIGIIAHIGKVSVLLPKEMASDLDGLVNTRMGLLRLDGYHVRCLDKVVHG